MHLNRNRLFYVYAIFIMVERLHLLQQTNYFRYGLNVFSINQCQEIVRKWHNIIPQSLR